VSRFGKVDRFGKTLKAILRKQQFFELYVTWGGKGELPNYVTQNTHLDPTRRLLLFPPPPSATSATTGTTPRRRCVAPPAPPSSARGTEPSRAEPCEGRRVGRSFPNEAGPEEMAPPSSIAQAGRQAGRRAGGQGARTAMGWAGPRASYRRTCRLGVWPDRSGLRPPRVGGRRRRRRRRRRNQIPITESSERKPTNAKGIGVRPGRASERAMPCPGAFFFPMCRGYEPGTDKPL
jgi:hypothetical protein